MNSSYLNASVWAIIMFHLNYKTFSEQGGCCVTAHRIAEIAPISEMVEWEGDQAFPSLLDVSLSLTQA